MFLLFINVTCSSCYIIYPISICHHRAKLQRRKTKVPSFYFDALELGNYWGCDGQPRRPVLFYTLFYYFSFCLFLRLFLQAEIASGDFCAM